MKTNTSFGCAEVQLDAKSEILVVGILDALNENAVIRRFDACGAEVTFVSPRVVTDLLKANATLNILFLNLHGASRLDEQVLRLIEQGLRENMALVDLLVDWGPHVVDGLPEIWLLLARNKYLVYLAAQCVTG